MKRHSILFITGIALFGMSLVGCGNAPSSNDNNEQVISVTGISLNYDSYNLYVNKSVTLQETVYPYNASNSGVTWSSSNLEVASVDANGKVTGLSVGSSTISVTTNDGNYVASCLFNVIENTEVDDDYVPTEESDIYTITLDNIETGSYDAEKDEYTFAISGEYKQIYVNVPEKTVILELSGVTIENNENSPIYVLDCEDIEISAKKNKVNYIKDTRSIYTEDDASQGKGAIYVSNGDLKLKGTGTLNIEAGYYNGIHCKDDVKIQKQILNITAVNHGIKGNDSITVTSGTINISCGGDGLHTENSDISDSGKQRGDIVVNGGSLTINSWNDAIQASHDVIFEESEEEITYIAKTNKNSSYSGETIEVSNSSFYLKMSSSLYSNGGYTYAAYINNSWYKASYKGTQTVEGGGGGGWGRPGPGGSTTYYIYEIERPSSSSSFTLYRFSGSNVTSFSTSSYNAYSDAKAFNDSYDMIQLSSISNKKISFGSWSNYSSNSVSAKGIKCENEIYIKGGNIDIDAYDDAIHANNDGTLENGSTPLGNVNISGGTLLLASSDDAIHADNELVISGGSINVSSAYEGLEGNSIEISGGTTYVFATDDRVNATSGKVTPNITVSGGYIDVTVPSSGDTDGVDSNGTFTQTGGVCIIKGPGSASGNTFGAAALDTDGAVKITSGTLIVFGGIEQTPTSSVTRTLCSSSTVSTGNRTVSFSSSSYTTNLKYSTNGCIVYSSLGSASLS